MKTVKHELQVVNRYRILVKNHRTGKFNSKIVSTPEMAADFYTMHSQDRWWTTTGHLNTSPHRYQIGAERQGRLYFRVLKVFKKHISR